MTISKRNKVIAAGAAVLAVAAGGAAIATAGSDDSEEPIPGSALQDAEAAALAHTGEGTVTDTEVGDEESLYEVEVTLDNGDQVDVQLDRSFNVVGDETESGGEEDEAPDS